MVEHKLRDSCTVAQFMFAVAHGAQLRLSRMLRRFVSRPATQRTRGAICRMRGHDGLQTGSCKLPCIAKARDRIGPFVTQLGSCGCGNTAVLPPCVDDEVWAVQHVHRSPSPRRPSPCTCFCPRHAADQPHHCPPLRAAEGAAPSMSRVQHRSGQAPHCVSRLGGETEIVQELSVMLDEKSRTDFAQMAVPRERRAFPRRPNCGASTSAHKSLAASPLTRSKRVAPCEPDAWRAAAEAAKPASCTAKSPCPLRSVWRGVCCLGMPQRDSAEGP